MTKLVFCFIDLLILQQEIKICQSAFSIKTMSQYPRRPILKKEPHDLPPKKSGINIRQNNPQGKRTGENQSLLKTNKNKRVQYQQNPEFAEDENPHKDLELPLQSPVQRRQNLKYEQYSQSNIQNQSLRRNSRLNDHWDDSFKSILKSNEAYRRELLSAYEEKVKLQTEKSKIQKEMVNLEFQKEQLMADNKELQGKLASANKNILNVKENNRKTIQQLEGDINRLKHQLNLYRIDKEELSKAYEESISISKTAESKLVENFEINRGLEIQNEELKSQMTFLLGKINQSEEDYFILEQKLNNSKKMMENMEIKLQRANEEAAKQINSLNIHESEINQLKIRNVEEMQQRDMIIDQKLREIAKSNVKLKEANDQINHIRQENSNLMSLVKSLKYLEQESEKLRKLPTIIEQLNLQNHQILRENTILKAQKEHSHNLFRNQSLLLDEVSKQYEQFIRISKEKEYEQHQIFEKQLQTLTIKINEFQRQLNNQKQKNSNLSKEIYEKDQQANYNAELIHKLQHLTQEKLVLIQKQTQEGKKLKENLEDKTSDTKQKRKKISQLEEIIKNQKEKMQYMIETNKTLLEEKIKCIQSLNKQITLEKDEKVDQEVRYKQSIKKLDEKLRHQGKEIELLKQKINQLEISQRELLQKCQNNYAALQKKQETIRTLNTDLSSLQDLSNKLKQVIRDLQREKKSLKDRQSQLNRALIDGQTLLQSKIAQNEDLRIELQELKKIREKEYTIQRESNFKSTFQAYQKDKEFEQKYLKSEEILKTIYKELSMYKIQFTELKTFNLSTLQKLATTFNSTQRYNLSRQIEKVSQLINKMSVLSTKVEKSSQTIKNFLQLKDINRNSILVKEGNMYKVNKYYNS